MATTIFRQAKAATTIRPIIWTHAEHAICGKVLEHLGNGTMMKTVAPDSKLIKNGVADE
jgi:hypothetical protein